MNTDKPLRTIAPGSRVTLHFTLGTEDGSELTSTFDGEPARVTLGDGSLIEGLELALIGLGVGGEQTITLSAEQAFGRRDESRIHSLPRSDFPDDMDLEPGLVVAFETPMGEELAGVVLETSESDVLVDFNHPLAGRDIVFRAKILEIGS